MIRLRIFHDSLGMGRLTDQDFGRKIFAGCYAFNLAVWLY